MKSNEGGYLGAPSAQSYKTVEKPETNHRIQPKQLVFSIYQTEALIYDTLLQLF